jgi:hypothetical protein
VAERLSASDISVSGRSVGVRFSKPVFRFNNPNIQHDSIPTADHQVPPISPNHLALFADRLATLERENQGNLLCSITGEALVWDPVEVVKVVMILIPTSIFFTQNLLFFLFVDFIKPPHSSINQKTQAERESISTRAHDYRSSGKAAMDASRSSASQPGEGERNGSLGTRVPLLTGYMLIPLGELV